MSRTEWTLIFYDGQHELTEMCVSKRAALRVARGKNSTTMCCLTGYVPKACAHHLTGSPLAI